MNDVGLTLQTMENVTLCAQGVHRTACVLCPPHRLMCASVILF